MFGIQSRGGCACAGPYAQRLLGMSEDMALKIEHLLLEDQRLDRKHLRRHRECSDKEILRPGFTRINLPYFFSDDEIDYVLKAVDMVATYGWKLLPLYMFNPETGEWKHKKHQVFKDRKWIGSIKLLQSQILCPKDESLSYNGTLQSILDEAKDMFMNVKKGQSKCGDQSLLLGEEGEALRWFLLPSEAQEHINNKSSQTHRLPFFPGRVLPSTNRAIIPPTPVNLHYCNCSGVNVNLINTACDLKYIGNGNAPLNKTDDIQELSVESSNVTPPICELDVTKKADILHKNVEPKETRFHNPSKSLFSNASEAIEEFNMIQDKDRVLLCLSGGKDSLSMLHVIRQYQFVARKKGVDFEFGAMTVDPKSSGYDPSPLKEYLKKLNVEYFYESQDIIGAAMDLPVCESICSFCSRMKRGRIYACARRENYNVVALGQHLDDAAESFLMSTFHNGFLRTMKACYTVRENDLRVIRPLIYVREKDLRDFADKMLLPVIPENCPACFEAPKERHRMKQLLAQQEILFPNLFNSLRKALHPLLSKHATGLESQKVFVETHGM